MEASKGISALSEMLQGIQRELDVGLESQKEHMLFRLNKGTCVFYMEVWSVQRKGDTSVMEHVRASALCSVDRVCPSFFTG